MLKMRLADIIIKVLRLFPKLYSAKFSIIRWGFGEQSQTAW